MSSASWNIARVGTAWSLSLPPKQKLVLLWLADQGDSSNKFTAPDMLKLTWFAGCTHDEVRAAMQKLLRRGLIDRVPDSDLWRVVL